MPRSSMWRAKQVSLSNVTEPRILGSSRRKAAVIAAMVSAAVLPARRVISVIRVLRSCSTSTGRDRLQITRSASCKPAGDARIAERPMARHFSGVSVVRSLRNVSFLRDRVAGRPAVARPSTGMAAGQEAPEPFRLLAGAVDPAVDRLRANGAQAGLDPEPQPSGDLLGRPVARQMIAGQSARSSVRRSVT